MQACNDSTSRENDTVKHFVPKDEPWRGSLRKHVGGCAPMLALVLLGVSVVALLVARCALHLKKSGNSTTFLRRLAEEVRRRAFTAHASSLLKSQTVPQEISMPLLREKRPRAASVPLKARRITAQCHLHGLLCLRGSSQHWHCPGGPSRAAPAGQDPPRGSPPPYEEGSWPSTSGVSHDGARRAYSLGDILGASPSEAIGPASRAATVSMLTLTAVDSSAPHSHRHGEPRHRQHLFSFPRISDSKVPFFMPIHKKKLPVSLICSYTLMLPDEAEQIPLSIPRNFVTEKCAP